MGRPNKLVKRQPKAVVDYLLGKINPYGNLADFKVCSLFLGTRKAKFSSINEFKEEVNQIRKRCMKALSFCSNLISDLSLAAKYSVESKIQSLLKELKQTTRRPQMPIFNI